MSHLVFANTRTRRTPPAQTKIQAASLGSSYEAATTAVLRAVRDNMGQDFYIPWKELRRDVIWYEIRRFTQGTPESSPTPDWFTHKQTVSYEESDLNIHPNGMHPIVQAAPPGYTFADHVRAGAAWTITLNHTVAMEHIRRAAEFVAPLNLYVRWMPWRWGVRLALFKTVQPIPITPLPPWAGGDAHTQRDFFDLLTEDNTL